jgi:hypothetical protein
MPDTILEEDHPRIISAKIPQYMLKSSSLCLYSQQSLVEIGSVVSEQKIFFNFITPFFYF